MKDNILEEIAKYTPPTRVPLIAMQATELYEAAGFTMTDEIIGELRKTLALCEDDLKALSDANIGLGVFALFLRDTRKDAVGAEMVAKLIRETAPKYAGIGERVVNALREMQVSAVSLLNKFTDRDESAQTRAPKFGEESPTGTLPLKELRPISMPPPRPAPTKKAK